MSVTFDAGTIRLAGICAVDEAEPVLALLDAHPGAPVDLAAATHLHTAIVQVLLARRPPICGAPPPDPFLATWIAPLLAAGPGPMSSAIPGADHADHDPDRR